MDNNTNSKTAFYFIGIIIVVAVLGWLFYSFGDAKSNKNSNSSGNNGGEIVDAPKVVAPSDATMKKNKAEIMNIISKNKVLTQEERAMITSALNGELIQFYGFSEAEKKQIIDALNRR